MKTMQAECKKNMDKHFGIVKIMPSEISSIKHAFEAIFSKLAYLSTSNLLKM